MSSLMETFLLVLLAVNTATLAVVFVLYRKARKAQKKRRVEAPNSQYKSQYVMDLESKERWESIDLAGLHEVNREEVEKTLAKLHATSVRALTSGERAFLDRMAEAQARVLRSSGATGTGRSRGDGPRRGGPGAPRSLPGTP